MDPSPAVDRRALLRAAAAVAGAAAVGGAVAAAGGATTSTSNGAGATEPPPARSAGRRTKAVRREHQTEHSGRSDEPATSDGRSPGEEPSEPTSSADSDDGVEPDGANGGDDRPEVRDDDGGTGQDDGNGNGSGDHSEDDGGSGNHGGPPAIVDTAAVPVGGGVVLAPYRVVVTQPVAGTFRCFGSRCTHAGCTVDDVDAGVIHCPCHGSLFDADTGAPVAGPAPEPLESVAITVKDGGVFLA